MEITNNNPGFIPSSTSTSAPKMAADPKSMEAFKGDTQSPEALQAAATQFESMMIEEMLKSMREATDTLADDNPFSSDQTRFYQGFYDSQLAFEMASQGTLGVANQIISQVEQIQGTANLDPPNTEGVEE